LYYLYFLFFFFFFFFLTFYYLAKCYLRLFYVNKLELLKCNVFELMFPYALLLCFVSSFPEPSLFLFYFLFYYYYYLLVASYWTMRCRE